MRNFKAFGETVEVEFGSVNLMYGENSSGKSSIIQSLLLFKQTLAVGRLGIEESALDFRGAIVDLGGFGAAVHGHVLEGSMDFSFRITGREESYRYRHQMFPAGVPVTYEMSFTFNQDSRKTRVSAFRMSTEATSIGFSYQDGHSNGEGMYLADAKSAAALVELWVQRNAETQRRTERLKASPEDIAWVRGFLRKTATDAYIFSPYWSPGILRHGKGGRPVGGSLTSPRRALLQEVVYDWQLWASAAISNLYETFADIHYIGPLRQAPQRVALETSSPSRELGSRGERALRLLSSDATLLDNLNRTLADLEIPYALEIRELSAGDESQDLGEISILSLRDVRSNLLVTLGDVGVGISQVLPVLIQLMLHTDAIIVVEQPELHLHPRLQSRLADVVLRSVLERRNRVFLETHSEHILLRLQRRMRAAAGAVDDHPLPQAPAPIDLNILYVEQTGTGASRLLKLRVDDEGELLDPWPSGFFDDRLEDLLADDTPTVLAPPLQG